MGFLDEAKKQGYTDAEAKDFQSKVQKAMAAGYSKDEIHSFIEKGAVPTTKKGETTIGPASTATVPDQGVIRAPMSTADETSALLSRGTLTDTGREIADAAPEVLGAGAALAAGGPAGIGAAMAYAAGGGAAGKGLQVIGQQLSGDPNAPKGWDAVMEMGGAAVRQGAAEGFGRVLIKSIAKVLRGGFFDAAEEVVGEKGTERLANKEAMFKGKSVKTPAEQEAILKDPDSSPKDVMESFGGNYTMAQMTKSRVLDFLDNMAQGSFLGGDTMGKAFDLQQKTVKEIGNKVSDMFVGEAGQKLSDRQLGQLFVDTVQGGRKAFKTSAEKMFRNVDDHIYQAMQLANPEEVNPMLFPGKTGTTVANPPSVMGAEPLPDVIPTKKPSEAGYVNIKPLIDKAKSVLSDYSRVRNIGKSDAGGTLLDKVVGLPETMNFGDAQLLRSVLLEEKRQLADEGGRSLMHVSDFAQTVDSQMEKAAKNLSGDALSAWRDANKFYKFGLSNFDNDFIHKVTRSGKVNWEEVGDLVFRSGNVDEVYKARNALRAAEFASKKVASDGMTSLEVVKPSAEALNAKGKPFALFVGNQEGVGPMYNVYGEHPSLSTGRYMHSTVAGDTIAKEGIPITGKEARVPDGVIPTGGKPTQPTINFQQSWRQMQSGYYESLIKKNTDVDGVLNPTRMLKDLQNRKTSRTIQAAFNNDQLNAVRNFAKAAKAATEKNQAGGGKLLIQLYQGGAVLGVSGMRGNYGEDFDWKQFASDAGKVILGPAILAKLMTNPITTRWLIQGMKTPVSSGAAAALATRIGVAAVRAIQNQPMISEDKSDQSN